MNFVRGCIRGYQVVLSPIFFCLGVRCRFYPSCSAYALTAFDRFSFWTALRVSSARLLRCHPRHTGGFDPVPTDAPRLRAGHPSPSPVGERAG